MNFGRIVQGYRLSSGNNVRLVAAEKRFRGGPETATQLNWIEGVRPVGALEGDAQSAACCGYMERVVALA